MAAALPSAARTRGSSRIRVRSATRCSRRHPAVPAARCRPAPDNSVIGAYRRAAPLVGLLGLAVAVALRVQLAGTDGARSQTAAIWFAVALAAVALAIPDR